MHMSYVIVILVILLKVFLPAGVFAHLAGQPPFFKVNGVYSGLYPVPTTSIADFPLPQDLGPDNYLVGKPIDFEIDTNQLPVPSDIVQKTTFSWDFGDGGEGSGLKNSHTYTKPGSYRLTIHAEYEQVSGNQLFQSVLLNVLPSPDYQLPKAKISVNGKTSRDPLVDILRFPYGTELTFDASGSSAPSSKIVEYFWDFGDSQTSGEAKTTHTYSKDLPQQQVFPVLRIKDENGFIADSFVEIDNAKSGAIRKPSGVLGKIFLGVGAIGAIVVGFLIFTRGKRESKQS
ncbi:MAG: PKD domain-containing protein [Candidatus Curtissbacteria bacterium]